MEPKMKIFPLNEIYPKIPTPLKIIRFLLPLFSKINKHRTAKYALELFCTTNHRPKIERFGKHLVNANQFKISVNDKNVAMYEWGSGDKIALFLHGWEGYALQFRNFLPLFLENNYKIVALDFPAHGASDGKQTTLPEWLKVLTNVSKKYGSFDTIIGHSFGGIAAINAIADQQIRSSHLITLGAASTMQHLVDGFRNITNLPEPTALKMIEILNNRFQLNFHDFSPLKKAPKIDIPTLIVHDTDDKTISIENATHLVKAGNFQFHKTNGLGHNLILNDKKTIQTILEFAEKNVFENV